MEIMPPNQLYNTITTKASCMTINSQSSSCHQCFYIIGVDIQGFIVLIHGFHVTTMFEVVHTCTHTERTKMDKELGKWVDIDFKSEEAGRRQTIITAELFTLNCDNYDKEMKNEFTEKV